MASSQHEAALHTLHAGRQREIRVGSGGLAGPLSMQSQRQGMAVLALLLQGPLKLCQSSGAGSLQASTSCITCQDLASDLEFCLYGVVWHCYCQEGLERNMTLGFPCQYERCSLCMKQEHRVDDDKSDMKQASKYKSSSQGPTGSGCKTLQDRPGSMRNAEQGSDAPLT